MNLLVSLTLGSKRAVRNIVPDVSQSSTSSPPSSSVVHVGTLPKFLDL